MAKGVGYGKVILFGEHFVVYGVPAIVAGISKKIEVELEEGVGEGWWKESVEKVKKLMNVKGEYRIKIKSEIPWKSGLGSSAAFSVALVRAFSNYLNRNYSEEEINGFAYELEKMFHGTPSGIDNSAATYGTTLLFRKKPDGFEVKKLERKEKLWIVLGVVEKEKTTKELVAEVRERKEKNEEWFQELLKKEEKLVENAVECIEKGKVVELGKLMNKNEEYLEEIGVVGESNRRIIELGLREGALGAKVSGAGGGGANIFLVQSEEEANKLEEKIRPYVKFSLSAFV